ncbi:MAG: hypothetical protein ABIQ72_00975 [Usitatibacter sp.]
MKTASRSTVRSIMFSAALAFTAVIAANVSTVDTPSQAPLQLHSKSAIANLNPNHSFAPFVAPLSAPDPEYITAPDTRLDQSRSSCASQRSLCYEPGSGRIIYKPARALMPSIPGLRRENISVKRDRITLKYSF